MTWPSDQNQEGRGMGRVYMVSLFGPLAPFQKLYMANDPEEAMKVEGIKTGEPLMLNVGAATTVGIVKSAREDVVDLNLKLPVCAESGQRIAISRRVGTRWRLIGYGILK